jgi:hypothetical protein
MEYRFPLPDKRLQCFISWQREQSDYAEIIFMHNAWRSAYQIWRGKDLIFCGNLRRYCCKRQKKFDRGTF